MIGYYKLIPPLSKGGQMFQLKGLENGTISNNKGFTLIEIAVVLVIIGLIIGAAVKGKDLIQSGKQKKFYTNVVKTWELTIVSYYDRTGMVLGDSAANGGNAANTNGRFDNINSAAEFTNVNNRLQAIGLEVPTSNTNQNRQHTFKGTYSGTQTINMSLLSTNGGAFARDNFLQFNNMPVDLAIALDTMIDGQTGSNAGNFRISNDGATWPDASTTNTVTTRYLIGVP